ncbi:MAG: hypothetical protein ACH350_09900 [Parachlamydiaceae bacterium]
MIKVIDFCRNYFNGFQDASNYKKNDTKTNVLVAVKILSYFTVVIPLGFAAIYRVASLCGCISKKESLPSRDQNINEKAKQIISKKTDITQITQEEIRAKQNIEATQPEIVSDNWGTITLKVNGLVKKFKDVIILPSDDRQVAEEWNWKWGSESMHHHPGIRIIDIDHLILSKTSKLDVIILTQGRGHGGQRDNSGPGVLEVATEVRDYIEQQGVPEIYILKTAAAIEKYNQIRSQGKKRIAALIHTTC